MLTSRTGIENFVEAFHASSVISSRSLLDDLDISGRSLWPYLMLPGGSRTICRMRLTFPGLDVYSTRTDLARRIMTAAIGSSVDGLDVDCDLLEL